MDGVLLINKARGPTSFDVVAEVRRRMSEKRVGHTGTTAGGVPRGERLPPGVDR